MPVLAVTLALAAAVAHAAWNIVAHGSSRSGVPFLWWGAVLSAGIWAFAVPLTGGIGRADIAGLLVGIAVSGALHVVYMLVLQRGYASGDLSTVYATARGTGPLLTVLIAMGLLGERPGLLALLGVALVVGGVVAFGIIGRAPVRQGVRGADPALVYGLLTGAAIAVYTVWDAYVVTGIGVAPVAFMVGCCAVEVLFFTALLLRRGGTAVRLRGELRRDWRRLLAFGVLSPLSYVLALTAVTMAPVSLVAPVREASVVLVGLYGVIRHRESRPVLRVAAAAVVLLGVLLIGL